MATRFALYHRMPPAPNRPPLPSSPADFAKLLDFHQALGALAAHPSLLPALGLVLPVEVPPGLCPPSPAAAQLPDADRDRRDAGVVLGGSPGAGAGADGVRPR